MARTKHTRPLAIRAADRVRRPWDPRGHGDPSDERAVLRRLKAQGVVAEQAPARVPDEWPLPRVIQKRARPGHFHPADRSSIRRLLRGLGEEACYGVRRIELRQGRPDERALGRLYVPGLIVLYDQRPSPWRLSKPEPAELERLAAAGARIEVRPGGITLVEWPDTSLRDFMLCDVLLHELGHHALQHNTGKRVARISRTRDHEAFADRFVRRGRP